MNLRKYSILGAFSALTAAGALLLTPAASAQGAEEENVQILTRGPVHEAFAESVSFEPEAGLIVSVRPPDPIEELPPEQQLEGDNVTWISGYWAWDDDQNDFIWISGIWRNLPPGRQWVPGYWSEIDGGKFQWTSGYWEDSTVSEVEYVSTAPPRNIDVGPNVKAPSDDYSWVPGNWYWAQTRYVWRPGYWLALRTNWTWVPSRYCWTRRGYVYVDGYWDYAVARRGVLFAPVYFHHRHYLRPAYYYTPSIVVSLGVFTNHLFVRPRSCHYYFGDYYAPRYRDAGFFASFSWHSGRRGYDPIYAYDRWHHRHDRHWERQRRDDYNYFRDHEDARPPRTWAAMRDSRDSRFNDGRNRNYATAFSGYAKENQSGQRFRPLDEGRRKAFVSQREEMRKFGQNRRQLESRGPQAGDRAKKTASREKLTRSPITGREAGSFTKTEGPPQRPETRADKSRVVPPASNKAKNGIARKNEIATSGKRKDGPERDAVRETPRSKTPAHEIKPKVEPGPNTGRTNPVVPKREVRPKSQVRETPRREIQPTPRITPAPKRQPQAAPKREPRPAPQIHKAPQREVRPKAQVRPAPERKPQATPKRETPKPQARQAPPRSARPSQQREIGPKQQSRPVPQTHAVPQRKAPSVAKNPSKTEKEEADRKHKGPKE